MKKEMLKKVKKNKQSVKVVKNLKNPKPKKVKEKIKIVMDEFKEGKLRSGSKQGPEVTNPRQAIAIAISESKKKKKNKK